MANLFPKQNIPNAEKTKSWVVLHRNYAIALLNSASPRIARITKAMNGYNLRHNPFTVENITTPYNKKPNKTNYVAYPWARPKIDLINNEFLLRPLNATVHTINSAAKSAKLDNYEMVLGVVAAKPHIEKLRQNGVDPLEGMDIPDDVSEDTLRGMSAKDMNEDLMQIIIDEQVQALDMKFKLAKCFLDIKLGGDCWGRVFVDEHGDECFSRIDPRNRVAEEIEDDIFFERSPAKGHRELMPIHDVLLSFKLTKDQQDYLETQRTSYLTGNLQIGTGYTKINGAVCVPVIFLEWYSTEPVYTKVSPKTKRQLAFDNSSDTVRMDMPVSWYEANPELHQQKSKQFHDKRKSGEPLNGQPFIKGKPNPDADYDVEIEYVEVAYREVFIGAGDNGICVYSGQAIDDKVSVVDLIKMPFTTVRVDNKKDVYSLSYIGARFNVVNGETIALYELIDRFARVLDNIMYKITQELTKFKGKSYFFNEDGLPRKGTIQKIMYEITNDGFTVFSASAQGSATGRPMTATQLIETLDIGFSESFPRLIELKAEMQRTLDRLTGINEQREGNTMASETATNAQSDKRASQIITEGLFYLMGLYTNRVFNLLCETTKLTWGLYKPEKGKVILGDKMFKFMQVTRTLAEQDYGVYLNDGGRELRLREKWEQDAQAALNAKDLRFKDIVQSDLATTLVEYKTILLNAYDEMAQMKSQEQQAEAKSQQDQNAQTLASQEKLAMDLEDKKFQNKLGEIKAQTDANIEEGKALGMVETIKGLKIQNAKDKNSMILDAHNHEQENNFNEQQ